MAGHVAVTHHGRKSVKVERRKCRALTLSPGFAGQSLVDNPQDRYPDMGRFAFAGSLHVFLLANYHRRRIYRTISLPLYCDCREGKGGPLVPADK